jgi:hypothetical protein
MGAFYHGIRGRRSWVRAPATHIPLRVIIPTYRSPYGGAHVAQTSEGGALTGTQYGECWNMIKGPLTPSISHVFSSQTSRGGSYITYNAYFLHNFDDSCIIDCRVSYVGHRRCRFHEPKVGYPEWHRSSMEINYPKLLGKVHTVSPLPLQLLKS